MINEFLSFFNIDLLTASSTLPDILNFLFKLVIGLVVVAFFFKGIFAVIREIGHGI